MAHTPSCERSVLIGDDGTEFRSCDFECRHGECYHAPCWDCRKRLARQRDDRINKAVWFAAIALIGATVALALGWPTFVGLVSR